MPEKDTCWLCFGTGRVFDLKQVAKREYEPGPDHDMPCPRGCEPYAEEGAAVHETRKQGMTV